MAAWTPPASDKDWTPPTTDKVAEKKTPIWKDFFTAINPFDPESLPAKAVEPGSTSESFIRALTNGASLGIGPKLARMVHGDDEAKAQAAAAEAHPVANVLGNVVGGLPQGLGVARSAIAAGPTLARQALGAAVPSAGLGAIQGAARTDKLEDLPANVGTDASIGMVGGAVSPYVAAGLSKVLPQVAKAFGSKTSNATATVLRDGPTPVAAAKSLMDQISLPGIGALGGMGSKAFGVGQDKAPWSTDVPSALIETGIAGAEGAALGAGAKYGLRAAGAAGDAALSGAKKGAAWIGQKTENALSNDNNVGADPFGKLGTWLSAGKESKNPAVQEAAAKVASVVDGADNDTVRKAGMAAQSTAEGRAATNSTSPVHDVDASDELEAAKGSFFKKAPAASTQSPKSFFKGNNEPMGMVDEGSYRAPGTNSSEESMDALMAAARRRPMSDIDRDFTKLRNRFPSPEDLEQFAKDNHFKDFGEYLENSSGNLPYKIRKLAGLDYKKRDGLYDAVYGPGPRDRISSIDQRIKESGLSDEEAWRRMLEFYRSSK